MIYLISFNFQDIVGEELVEVLQIKNKIPRRKALSFLEDKVLSVLTEKGYIGKAGAIGSTEMTPEFVEDEEDEEIVVDGEVDEGDVHIKPVPRKPIDLVGFSFFFSICSLSPLSPF